MHESHEDVERQNERKTARVGEKVQSRLNITTAWSIHIDVYVEEMGEGWKKRERDI